MFFEPLLKKSPCLVDGGVLSIRVGKTILLDTGSVVSILTREEQRSIRNIFLTHAHLDHIKDLGFLAESLFDVFTETVSVWGTAKTLKMVKKHVFNGEIWPDFTELPNKKKPVMTFREINPKEAVNVDSYKIIPVEVNHIDGAVAYIISDSGENLVLTGDTGPTDELWNFVNKLDGQTTIFIETSFPNRLTKVADDSMHLTPVYLKGELEKIEDKNAKIMIYHVKTPYYEEISKEIGALGDPRVRILS